MEQLSVRFLHCRRSFIYAALGSVLLGLLGIPVVASAQVQVGKWKRFEVSYPNSSWSGNPFDLDFRATFTHTQSGRRLTQLGFYAGSDTWTIYFMPDELGEWTFTTSSPDADLDTKSGTFSSIASGLEGKLMPDGNRWKLSDTGKHEFPIMIPTRQWFKRTNTSDGVGIMMAIGGS